MQNILSDLNEFQLEAVKEVDNPILILAGAGSGKTKTITSRLAYLVGEVGIDPSCILTLTFTNKAATSMRDKALDLLRGIDKPVLYPPLLCTFHKFGLLFLKFNINKLNRANTFVVIDTDDKKRILKSFNSEIPIPMLASEISKYKNSLITPTMAKERAEQKYYKEIALIYEKYEQYILSNNLVDFDDLIALPYKILDENEDLCEQISNRYQYIMVDEYQDTNDLQYKLLKKMCHTHQNICVVGDDDQSIYGWRGANVKNILEFADNFKNTKVIKLEKNYRSTNQILKAANELIDHNRNRLGKTLISENGDGKEIEFIEAQDEMMESSMIAKRIRKLIDSRVDPRQIAVLYRINALSRSIEEGLNKERIAYKMVGGVKFYERAEIKDVISYLRIIANPHDDFSFRRILNRPKRGIGKVAMDKILKGAYEHKTSIYDFIKSHQDQLIKDLNKKSIKALNDFVDELDNMISTSEESIYNVADRLEDAFGLRAYYSKLPDAIDRVSNIDEFYGLFRDQIKQTPDISIDGFLNDLALQSDQDQIDAENISIMSVHASKGLEFDYLFVIGLEEGFFPLIGDGSDIEEERRLGYVAITRARKELVLSCSQSRFYKGRRTDLAKSRFLTESGVCQGSLVLEKSTSFKKGDLVKHKIFGMGRILEVSKVKREFKLKINFGGTKKDILASFVEKI
ncbi:MAG: ATP-dependent DNA helicase [Proteobacteria bacterium]|nr:MAG: ATP-dependent DNA helicase [Pseudomonadota bacterium]